MLSAGVMCNCVPRGARGTEPETFTRRDQLVTCPPTAGPESWCSRGSIDGALGNDWLRFRAPHDTTPGMPQTEGAPSVCSGLQSKVSHRAITVQAALALRPARVGTAPKQCPCVCSVCSKTASALNTGKWFDAINAINAVDAMAMLHPWETSVDSTSM